MLPLTENHRHLNIRPDSRKSTPHEQPTATSTSSLSSPLQRHRATRRDWCTRHVRWQRAQWASVLFSDESRFALQFNDGKEQVYRRPGERFADVNVNQRLLFGGGSVTVWVAFSFNDRTPLYVIDGDLNGNRYLQEVIQHFDITALQPIGAAAMCQDDDARPHRARVVKDFLRLHNVNRTDWPPYSPDLSPIEHAWDELRRRLRSNYAPPTIQAHLACMLVAEWQAIPQAFFQRLVNNMRRRCTVCINARGGYTHYKVLVKLCDFLFGLYVNLSMAIVNEMHS